MLLDMSRIEAGRFELQTEAFQPDALIEPCLQIVDPMAREKSIRLMTEVPGRCRRWSPTSGHAGRSSSTCCRMPSSSPASARW